MGKKISNNKQPVTSHSALLIPHQYFGKWQAISNLFFSSFYISAVCHFSAFKHAAASQVAEVLELILLLLVSQKILALSNSKFAIFENYINSTYVQNLTSSKETKHARLLAYFFVSKQYSKLILSGLQIQN